MATFEGQIKVASRIIDYLSSGLYQSPAACLKELVNNSFDADATRVDVFVKPDADRIIIRDDGVGMSQQEFQAHFDRVSESVKRGNSDTTKSGRKKIGKIGIGFIAANELCEVMEVFSTKRGSTLLLHVTINFEAMRKPLNQRRKGETDFVKADYVGEVLECDPTEHFTEIYLQRVRGGAKDILAGARPQTKGAAVRSLYGLSADSVRGALASKGLKTWKEFDAYSETMLKVGLNVPVKYHDGWLPVRYKKRVKEFESEVAALRFSVFYDNSELRKPVVFVPKGKAFVELFEFTGQHVSARGYFFAQHATVKPTELQGLLVRVRNAAIGEYDNTFWQFSQSEFSLIQKWISCEVWGDDRLEDAMNIDRKTLRETHPAYVELRAAIHDKLREVCAMARSRIYEASSKTRNETRVSDEMQRMIDTTDSLVGVVSADAASIVKKELRRSSKDPSTKRRLLKKFTVSQLYEFVLQVAARTLPASHYEKFAKALSEQLLR